MNIYQIEITNKCQFSCIYCPRTLKMTRKIGTISFSTIDRISEVISSSFVSLDHFGESLLEIHKVIYAIKSLKKMNEIYIQMCTNGEFLDGVSSKLLFDSGIDSIKLSYHNKNSVKNIDKIPFEFRDKIDISIVLRSSDFDVLNEMNDEISKIKDMGYSFKVKQLRDLGQIQKNSDVSNKNYKQCSFLNNNEFVVLWNGDIVNCCECFNGEQDEIRGNIFDLKLPDKNKVIKKCFTCNGYGNSHVETELIDF